MATVKVVDILSRAAYQLGDADFVRWTTAELQAWLNDGYRDVVTVLPEANTVRAEFTCSAGYKQTVTAALPAAVRVMSVDRNTAPASNKAAVTLVSRPSLESQRRNWINETPSVSIEQYMFDPRMPKEFLVYPPAAVGAKVEILYAEIPTAHNLSDAQLKNPSTAEVIRLDDIYANALLDYVLYRAYSKDSEAGSANRAVAHYQAFQAALGIKGQRDAASQPGVA